MGVEETFTVLVHLFVIFLPSVWRIGMAMDYEVIMISAHFRLFLLEAFNQHNHSNKTVYLSSRR